jgi:protein-L-isoaspartate(D-aspartate) O-methyltransferase
MKSTKAIWLILLAFVIAAIAGVVIGVSVVASKPPSVVVATNATDNALVYHEVEPAEPATNFAETAPGHPVPPSAGSPVPELPQFRPMPLRPLVPALRLRSPPPALPSMPGVRPVRLVPMALLRGPGPDDRFAAARERMVQEQLIGRGFTDPAVISAMRTVPRQSFVPGMQVSNAYVDMTLDCGYGRILETPFVIASTAAQLAAQPGDRVLEVNAAPGYATAVYSKLVKQVYAIQSIHARTLEVDLQVQGFTNNVFVREAGAAQGWPEAAPFDTIVFNGPLAQISESLLAQLKPGGRLILPVTDDGKLCVLKKSGSQLVLQTTLFVRPTPIPGNQVALPSFPAIVRQPPPR